MPLTKSDLVHKRAEYVAAKEAFRKKALAELQMYQGAILLLEALIKEEETNDAEGQEGQVMADGVSWEDETPDAAVTTADKVMQAVESHCAEYPEDCEPVEEAIYSAP